MTDILGRMKALEESMETNSRRYENSVASILELISAVIKSVGPDFQNTVESSLKATRLEAAVNKAKEEEKVVADLVAKGKLVVVDTIGPKTIVIAKETDKNGNLVNAGRIQVQFEQFFPEVQPKMLGQKVGFVYENPAEGQKYEIKEIYGFAPEAPPTEAPAVAETK